MERISKIQVCITNSAYGFRIIACESSPNDGLSVQLSGEEENEARRYERAVVGGCNTYGAIRHNFRPTNAALSHH